MARGTRRDRGEDSTPGDYIPQTTPEATFGARHDSTQLLQMMMEVQHNLGRLMEKVDGINARLDKTETKVSNFNDTVNYLKGALVVGGAVFITMIGLFWYFVGDKITETIKGKPVVPQAASAPVFPTPPVPNSPPAPSFQPPK